MNLYKINFTHYAPKDSQNGILKYTIATNDAEICDSLFEGQYYYIDDSNKIEYEYESESEKFDNIRDELIFNRGDAYRDDLDNLYYGVMQYWWELVKENISNEEIKLLKELEIVE